MGEGRADALRPRHKLHVYSIAEVLGAGGFGITYRAVEDFTGRQVAIKEYLPSFLAFREGVAVRPISESAGADFAWGLERFRQEAKTLHTLRHPAIVPVLQYFEANGTGYLVMEYQDGQTLGALLKPDKTLDRVELEEILAPLLEGFSAIHAKGFLHRDVKPDNIFIRRDGAPLLLDFGAARQAIGERSRSLTTIVSEGYAPFEQYESSGNQGPWTDIYAMGATLYRCMTGTKPVPAPARVMATMQGARDPLPPLPRAVREHYGERLARAVEVALTVNAIGRPQSIAALRDMLRDHTEWQHSGTEGTLIVAARPEPKATIVLGQDRPSSAPRRQLRRVPIVASAAASLLLLLGAGLALASSADRYLDGPLFEGHVGPLELVACAVVLALHLPLLVATLAGRHWACRALAWLLMSRTLPALFLATFVPFLMAPYNSGEPDERIWPVIASVALLLFDAALGVALLRVQPHVADAAAQARRPPPYARG